MSSSRERLGKPCRRCSATARNVRPLLGSGMRSPPCLPLPMWCLPWSNWLAGRRRQHVPAGTSGVRSLLRILHPEPDLERDLEVLDLTIGKVSADVTHLEPVETAQRTSCPLHRNADCVVDSLSRGANDFRQSVHMTIHGLAPSVEFGATLASRAYSALATVASPKAVSTPAVTRLSTAVTRGRRSQTTAPAAMVAKPTSQTKATAVSIAPSVKNALKTAECGATNCGTI